MKNFLVGILLLTACFQSSRAWGRVDNSLDIFFPQSLKYLQKSQEQFSVFWWNFIVVDAKGSAPDFVKAQDVCASLHPFSGKQIQHLICGDDIGDYSQTLASWAQDLILRENFNATAAAPEAYRAQMLQSLTEISYMGSQNSMLFNLKRVDPTDQWQLFLQRSQSMAAGRFQRQQGFLVEPSSSRIVIPVQFAVLPKMDLVQDVASALENFEGVHWVGGHASAYTNEKQVHRDMDSVSLVGILVLVGFVLFLVLKGRVGALLIFPPVFVAMGIAAWLVQIIDGSIHGLTLAFGSGIIGLAVDYGLHGTFNAESKHTWRSNLIGLLTTLVGLGVLAASGIPLIRQMMLFAILGICTAYIFFFLLCKYAQKYFRLRHLPMPFVQFRYSGWVIAAIILFGLYGASRADLTFDIRKFNYQLPADAEATNWFFSQGGDKESFLILHDTAPDFTDVMAAVVAEQEFGQKNGLQYEGVGAYLPAAETQKINQASWTGAGCTFMKAHLNESQQKVFRPFLENICQGQRVAVEFAEVQKKPYLQHLIGGGQWMSLFFATDPAQQDLIRKQYPQAHSLVESVKGFAKSLNDDLVWMIPAVFILCSLILALYYRNAVLVLASYIPFLSGLGLFWLAKSIFGGPLDLISVLGLLMVFGFSVDYAVFVTDVFAFKQDKSKLPVVYSVLTLAALTNVIGFCPLVLAKHPILHQLGFVLVFGTLGTYFGTRWGLEKFLQKWENRKNA